MFIWLVKISLAIDGGLKIAYINHLVLSRVTSYTIFSRVLHSMSTRLLAGMSARMKVAMPPPWSVQSLR